MSARKNIRCASYLLLLFVLFLQNLVSAGNLRAEICAPDPVPAATLLVPYFEVQIPKKCARAQYTTQVAITNVTAAPVIARAVIWSEWSVPVYGFNLYLKGYEVKNFDLLDLLCRGEAVGVDNALDADKPTSSQLALMRAWLTGKPSPEDGTCASHPKKGNKAVGYITVDAVQGFTDENPTDGLSYISGLSHTNSLVGDIYYIDNKVGGAKRVCGANGACQRKYKKQVLNQRGIRGVKAVSVEAASGATFSAGDRTFYGRYIGGTAQDRREPLPDAWHVRYSQNKLKKKYNLIVWREGNASYDPVNCSSEPDFHPMSVSQVVIFNEDADASAVGPNDEPLGWATFHDEAQEIQNPLKNSPFKSRDGWLYINFATLFTENPAYGSEVGSSWVMTRRDGIIDEAGAHPLYYGGSCGSGAPTL